MSVIPWVIGKYYRAQIVTALGVLIVPNVTGIHQKQERKKVVSDPLNAPPQHASFPQGWTVGIDFDRTDNTVDAYFAAEEANFWNGGQVLNGTLYVYITEVNGSQSRYMFNNCAFSYDDAGTAKGVDKVSCKISAMASTRTALQ